MWNHWTAYSDYGASGSSQKHALRANCTSGNACDLVVWLLAPAICWRSVLLCSWGTGRNWKDIRTCASIATGRPGLRHHQPPVSTDQDFTRTDIGLPENCVAKSEQDSFNRQFDIFLFYTGTSVIAVVHPVDANGWRTKTLYPWKMQECLKEKRSVGWQQRIELCFAWEFLHICELFNNNNWLIKV